MTQLAANPAYKPEEVKSAKYETDQLRISLSKIAQLLQVGFGEAGNNLVAENLKKGDSVDPMVPGKKLLGAYGFCIIDDYEEVLECLGPDILPYTNTAADIVHKAVVANGDQRRQPRRGLPVRVGEPKLSFHATEPQPHGGGDENVRRRNHRLSPLRASRVAMSVHVSTNMARMRRFRRCSAITQTVIGPDCITAGRSSPRARHRDQD